MNEPVSTQSFEPQTRSIRFVDQVSADQTVFMTFAGPSLRYAVESNVTAAAGGPAANQDTLSVTLIPATAPPSAEAPPGPATMQQNEPAARLPILILSGETTLRWAPEQAALRCTPEQTEPLLQAIVEFTHYESELRKLEREIASTWQELEQDKSLAFQVTPADLARSAAIGARVDLVLERRIRHARIGPHLMRDAASPSASRKIARLLRKKAATESRLEAVDGQLEVFEGIYEMGSQRLGEFRASSQEHTLEWVIIILLTAETLLMAVQAFWHFGA